jgi:hypothetical protein
MRPSVFAPSVANIIVDEGIDVVIVLSNAERKLIDPVGLNGSGV